MKTKVIILTTFIVASGFLAQTVEAQKRTLSALYKEPSDNPGMVVLLEGSGETISKKGVIIKYAPEVNKDSLLVGYMYEKQGFDSLKVGDAIAFYIKDLKSSSIYASRGDWKTVTIESIRLVKNKIEIVFKGNAELKYGKIINKLIFVLKDDYWIDITNSRKEEEFKQARP